MNKKKSQNRGTDPSRQKIPAQRPTRPAVIRHFKKPLSICRKEDLVWLLDIWHLVKKTEYTPEELEILSRQLPSAAIGSGYTNAPPLLSVRQLVRLWNAGCATHDAFIDRSGNEIDETVYIVGASGSVLSGNHIFWGIIPSQNAIIISDRFPSAGKFNPSFVNYLTLFAKAAKT